MMINLPGRRLYATILFTLFVSIVLFAKGNGKVGKTLKDNEGCDCHGDLSKKVSVVISGPTELKPKQIADYTVTVTGGPLMNAGIDIASSAGTLVPGSTLRLAKGELTHKDPVKPENGKVSFAFKLMAPEDAGEIILYAAGNSSNGDDSKKGDLWNHANNFKVKVLTK